VCSSPSLTYTFLLQKEQQNQLKNSLNIYLKGNKILYCVSVDYMFGVHANLGIPSLIVDKVDAWLWVALHLEIQWKHSNLQVAPAPPQIFEGFLHQHTAPSLNTPHKSGIMKASMRQMLYYIITKIKLSPYKAVETYSVVTWWERHIA
jgi:hypothetical protein